jgi:mono/diheme cytochrome c family protein
MPLRAAVFLFLLVLLHRPSLAGEPPAVDFGQYLAGKYVYERNCMVCHGARGDGTGELAATLQPRPRSFREGMFKFRSTPFGALPTEDDLARTIRGGLSGTAMGMFTQLPDEEVRAVIEYVKSFSRRWRKGENYAEPMKLPAPPAWLTDEPQRALHVAAGKALFLTHCASCHGADADGKGPAGAALVDVWNLPTKPADLRQPHLRCGDAPADIYRVLATGLNGTPMVSFDATLTPEQRWDIVAYLFTLRLPDVPNLGAAPASSLQLREKP